VFAEREGVKVGTLRHWAWRLGRDVGDVEPKGFVEVVLPPERGSGVEIVVRDEIYVRVARDFDKETLQRVLAVAREH
jgi:hypothetical protein